MSYAPKPSSGPNLSQSHHHYQMQHRFWRKSHSNSSGHPELWVSGAGSPKMLSPFVVRSSLQTGNLRSLTCIPKCWGKQEKPETDVHVGSFCNAPKSPLPSINLQPLAGNKSLKSKDIKACHFSWLVMH